MKPMDNKSPEIKDVIESIFPGTKAAIDNYQCPLCKKPIDENRDFRDTLSQKEYYLSGLCQNCQDRAFGTGDE